MPVERSCNEAWRLSRSTTAAAARLWQLQVLSHRLQADAALAVQAIDCLMRVMSCINCYSQETP